MTHTRILLASASVLSLLAPAAAIAQAPTGAVQGRVVSSATGAPLPGAEVRVEGSSARAVTDEAGAFSIAAVPAGPAVVTINYLGLEPAAVSINVAAGGVADASASLGAVGAGATMLDAIEVRSQRLAQNEALNRYRNSDAIANYVAADDVGQFVDQNVAESLQRLPGIAITRDQGEGRFVSVRGIDAGLSTVTINGMRIGTPEDGSRAVPLDVIPSGSIDLLEITKVPTPDMPGDAIGGSIDVRSGSPFNESREHNWRYRLEGSYGEMAETFNPEGRLNYANVFSIGGGDRNFGVSVGLNYLDRQFESTNVEAEYDYFEFGGDDVFAIGQIAQRKYQIDRQRLGANVNLEFRPSSQDTFLANALFSRFTDAESRQANVFNVGDGEITAYDGVNITYDTPGDALSRRGRFRTKDQDTFALSFGGEHLRGLWTIDYQIGASVTDERVLDEVENRFEYTGDDLVIDVVQGQGIPTFAVEAGAPYLDHSLYELERAIPSPTLVDDDDMNVRFNVERAEAFGVSGLTLRAGADYRTKDKRADINEVELRVVPSATLDQFPAESPNYDLGLFGPGIDSEAARDFFEAGGFSARPQDVAENQVLSLAEDFEATEDVTAGYVMGTWDNGPLRLIAGVRVEQTKFEATGNELTLDDNGDLSIASRSVSSDYTDVLPGIHARYSFSDDLILRAAWSNTIARPSFSDISPRFQINMEDLEIEAGNPDLDPYRASNLDLMLDWYPGGSSIVSVGVFHKDIKDYIVERGSLTDPVFPGYDVTRPENATNASVTGIEVNLEQQLGAWWPVMDAFLIGANATYLDTELDVDGRTETFTLPQSAERTANLYLGYEQGRFSGRVSYSFRDEYLEEIGDSAEYDLYVKASEQLDLTASYRITDAFEFFVEAQNLLDDPLELYQGSPEYVLQFEEYGRTFAVGLKGRF